MRCLIIFLFLMFPTKSYSFFNNDIYLKCTTKEAGQFYDQFSYMNNGKTKRVKKLMESWYGFGSFEGDVNYVKIDLDKELASSIWQPKYPRFFYNEIGISVYEKLIIIHLHIYDVQISRQNGLALFYKSTGIAKEAPVFVCERIKKNQLPR